MTINLVDGLKWYMVFLFSTTLHEAAHAWTALKLGDDTAYRGGQVTLDPTPHIKREPLGMVAVPILSYFLGGWMIGWASTPYNPQWALHNPRRSAWMSLAGPGANLLLVLLAALAIRMGMVFHVFEAPARIGFSRVTVSGASDIFIFLAKMLSILFSLNLLLCTFNLMPLPPLDGSGLILFFTGSASSEKYLSFMRHPTLNYVGLMIAWRMFDVIYPPVHLFAVNVLYPGMGYR